MNLYFRLLILIIKSRFKPRLNFTGRSILKFYVLPTDLDINMHMNNGRYNSIMDLGRVDIMLRNGIVKLLFKNNWVGIVGSIHTRFRRPLKLFQAYELHSQVIFWDEKWTWIEHKIYSKNKLICSTLAQSLVRGKGENICSSALQKAINVEVEPLEITDEIKLLQQFSPLE